MEVIGYVAVAAVHKDRNSSESVKSSGETAQLFTATAMLYGKPQGFLCIQCSPDVGLTFFPPYLTVLRRRLLSAFRIPYQSAKVLRLRLKATATNRDSSHR